MSAGVAPDAVVPPAHASPGICFGARTVCSPTAAKPFDLGPEVTCNVSDQGSATITWKTEIPEMSCPIGRCVAVSPQISAGADGSLWAIADLSLPGSDAFVSKYVFGTGLSRYDGAGKWSFSTVADFPTTLSGKTPTTIGMNVDARGHLQWIAPTPGAPGIELRDYHPKGRLVSARRLVDDALFGTGRSNADGSTILVYEYAIPAPGGAEGGAESDSPSPTSRVDVARFDAEGRLVWNQTAASALGLGEMDGFIGAVDATGDGAVLAARVAADTTPARSVIARLDGNGNITWARDAEDADISIVALLSDGSTIVEFLRTDTASPARLLVKLSATGESEWHMNKDDLQTTGSSFTGVADARDRTWVTVFGFGNAFSLYSIAPDGLHCTKWSLAAPGCQTQPNGEIYCTNVSLEPDGQGAFAFGAGITVGRFTVEGAP